jgi:Ni/Fe-hydrogenase subunit HybB-like protein
MGFAMVAFESIVGGRAMNHSVDAGVLRALANGAKFTLLLYLVVRGIDLIARGNLPLAFAGDLAGNMFLLEIVAGVLVPVALYSLGSRTLWAHGLAIAGVVLNRFNVTFFSQAGAGGSYFPSIAEILITAGLVSFLLLAYRFLVLRLPVLAHEPQPVGRA